MPAIIVIGAQWGDEGKGKVVDLYAAKSDIVMRYQGGHNAGHTVWVGGERYVLHLIPSGIIQKNAVNLIGNGVVVELDALTLEIEDMEKRGIDFDKRFFISTGAHIIMPYHIVFDQLRENLAGDKKIGTTGRGIGPCYADKAARTGIRVGDLLNPAYLKDTIKGYIAEVNLMAKNRFMVEMPIPFDADSIANNLISCGKRIAPYIANTSILANRALKEGKKLLLEGAQGTLLDIDFGTYPYVTSSNGSAGGACTGTGISPLKINKVVGVVKAYSTRVGGGALPTELNDSVGLRLREQGQEFGATTGRPRRCGYLDLVGLKYSVMINGFSHIALTKLDVLSGIQELKVCTAYKIDGEETNEFPMDITSLERAKPVYKSFSGWDKDISGAKKLDDLPKGAREYVDFISASLETPYCLISVSPDRDSNIILEELF